MDTNLSTQASLPALLNSPDYTLTKLDEQQRLDYPAQLFGADFLRYEMAMYAAMDRFSGGLYPGGYWEYYRIDHVSGNSGFAMILEDQQIIPITNTNNYYDGSMSYEALSLALNSYLSSHMSFGPRNAQAYAENYHLVYEACLDHPEHAEIIKFLD